MRRELAGLIAVSWAGSLAFLFISLQPMLIGAWVGDAGLSRTEASTVLAANIFGALIGNIVAIVLAGRVRVRPVILVGALVMAAGAAGVAALPGAVGALWPLLFVSGFGGGLLGAAAAAAAGAMPHPNRVFAIIIAAQILTGAAAILSAPHILAAFGITGLFVGVVTVTLILAPMIAWFYEPDTKPIDAGSQKTMPIFTRRSVLLLLSLAILYVANNAVWAYTEQIGVGAGLTHAAVGVALAIGQASSLAFAVAAGVLEKMRRDVAIAGGVVLMAVSAPLFALAPNFAGIAIAVTGFLGAVCFVVPFYMGALAVSDRTGRLVVWGQGAITIGLMVGPPAAAFVIEVASMQAMIWASVVVTLIAVAIAALAFRPIAHREAE